jgi:hypothetical protein
VKTTADQQAYSRGYAAGRKRLERDIRDEVERRVRGLTPPPASKPAEGLKTLRIVLPETSVPMVMIWPEELTADSAAMAKEMICAALNHWAAKVGPLEESRPVRNSVFPNCKPPIEDSSTPTVS